MKENETQFDIPHFSKKILLLSAVFLLINVAWYALVLLSGRGETYRVVAPALVLAGDRNNIEVKSPYDADFRSPRENQPLLAGTAIRTGEKGFVQIVLDSNVLRLDQDSEIRLSENNFMVFDGLPYETEIPRLAFTLEKGSVWVNAFDPIAIKTQRSSALFAHSVGSYTYATPMNRIMVITGGVDLSLKNEKGKTLTTYVIPFRNQATYADSQIVPDYARLQPSKLRKELKLAMMQKTVLEDEWVARNIQVDTERLAARTGFIDSPSVYAFWDRYYKVKASITFSPPMKRQVTLAHARLKLNYLLGGMLLSGDETEAKRILDEFNALIARLPQDAGTKQLLGEALFGIGTVDFGSTAYLVKENLREELLALDGHKLLRSYFSDLAHELDKMDLDQAGKVASSWISQWKKKGQSGHEAEFGNQARMLQSLLISYVDRITPALLAIQSEAGEMRIMVAENTDETLLAISQERLELSGALVGALRYLVAKDYLKQSYETLGIDEIKGDVAVKEIFLEQAKLLAQRIEYAEKELHGAAKPIDETEFQDYMARTARDKLLSENLKAFLEVGAEKQEEVIPPAPQEAVDRFAAVRISVLMGDLVPEKDNPFAFTVKTARLIDRDQDGKSITFEAVYDFTTNAVHDLAVNGEPFRGNYELHDLVMVLTARKLSAGEKTGIISAEGLDLYITGEGMNEEALRAQLAAQDMAVQLAIKELVGMGVRVAGAQNVEVLDPATLFRFKIHGALVENLENSRLPYTVDFDYSSASKTASTIYLPQSKKSIPGEMPVAGLKDAIMKALNVEKQIEAAKSAFGSQLTEWKLLLSKADMAWEGDRVRFQHMKLTTLPLEVEGVYDTKANQFAEVKHELLTSQNIAVPAYFNELGRLFIADYLTRKELVVGPSQITAEFPFETILVSNYASGGQTYDFEVDISGNRLKNVVLKETGARVDSMTFEEFKTITGQL